MNAQSLKKSILQYAVQGKLVKQNPNDEPAIKLLERIKTEKEKLIKQGKIKKEKILPPIDKEEIPFEIPKSWQWVRLENIANINGGYAFKSSYYLKSGIRVIRISDFDENGLKDDKSVYYCENIKYDDFILDNNDILLAMTGGTVGKSYYVNNLKEKMYVNQRVADIKINKKINSRYINYVILSPLTQDKINICKNSTNDNISIQDIKEFLIPLPSLVEQERIVKKLEQILPLVEEYGKNEEKLSELNKSLPDKIKQSILQYAVQGKLVKQNPNDEPAIKLLERIKAEKEKLIKEGKIKKDKNQSYIFRRDNSHYEKIGNTEHCIDLEIPFETPKSWQWTRLGNILEKLTDGTHSTPKYVKEGIPFLSVKNISQGKISFDNIKYITKEEHIELYKRCDPQKGDILLTKVGTTGIPVIVDTNIQFSVFVSIAQLRFNHKFINSEFLKYMILSPLVQNQCKENTKGIGNKNWVINDIANTLIVIPPIQEQKRIVEKVKQIFSFLQ